MPIEKPTPINQSITLRITHPEKERYELCEIECGAGTTLDDLKAQICAKTGLQARILVMAKRYDADGDLDEAQRAALRAQAYVNWVRAGVEINYNCVCSMAWSFYAIDAASGRWRGTLRRRADVSMIEHQQDTGIWHAPVSYTHLTLPTTPYV